jgi:hypothetical protein
MQLLRAIASAVTSGREESASADVAGDSVSSQRVLDVRMNPLLDSAASVVAGVLDQRGIAVAAPVTASFQTSETGSSGVDVRVKLEDPSQASAAERAIRDHCGGDCDVDDVRIS